LGLTVDFVFGCLARESIRTDGCAGPTALGDVAEGDNQVDMFPRVSHSREICLSICEIKLMVVKG
jgi:hypothetical protein